MILHGYDSNNHTVQCSVYRFTSQDYKDRRVFKVLLGSKVLLALNAPLVPWAFQDLKVHQVHQVLQVPGQRLLGVQVPG